MSKKRVISVILIIILVLIALFSVCTIRKMVIIKDLSKKLSKAENSTSYYVKINNNVGMTTEYYYKEDNAVLFFNTTSKTGEERKLTNYFKGEVTNTYIEAGGDKVALLNSNGLPSKIMFIELGDIDTLWDLFKISVATSIKESEYNGKSCYILNFGKPNEEYREIETGLRLKAKDGTMTDYDNNGETKDIIVEYQYEFKDIEDSIFIEPDISQYRIQENN